MKAARVVAVVALALALGAVEVGVAQQSQAGTPALEVISIRPNVYMIAGAGGNIAVQLGSDGVIVVDAGSAAPAQAVVDEIRKITPLPIRYIINTSDDADHVGGNETLARAGQSLFFAGNLGPGGGGGNTGINNGGAASIIGTENMFLRMSGANGEPSRYAVVAQPTETFARRLKVMYLNDESIQIIHPPSAHTDGDAIVLFRQSDVIVAGDVFDMTRFPVIDLERGGSIQGEIAVLNELIDLTVPSIPLPWKDGGTTVIPGHGRLSQQAELVEYRDMVTIIAERVQDMVNHQMTLDQIKKASPTQGWDRRFGSNSGSWTTDMFVEAVYKSLTAPKPPKT
jgi:glyoxylase-like metal-dependent hydrolase (beta-lactamase superfamily II)